METVVLNATPLIYLIKVGLPRIFEELPLRFVTVSIVKEEVVTRGKKVKVPDAFMAESLFKQGLIRVEDPKGKAVIELLSAAPRLHIGEAKVLALAKERGYIAIVDDLRARRVAQMLGIRFEGTPFLLATGVLNGKLTKDEAVKAVEDLIHIGWRCGAREYARIVHMLKAI